MPKKPLSLTDLGLVYSTGSIDKNLFEDTDEVFVEPKKQKIRVRPESVKGGKWISKITGFELNNQQLEELTKTLKVKVGVGGSCKNNEIIIQGNHCDRIINILKEMGYNDCKKSGG